jgi:hypothetical protein
MSVLLLPPIFQFFDNNGQPLANGFVYTYAAGTTTPKETYTSSAGTIAAPNPIELNSSGRPSSGSGAIWGAGGYKFIVRDANGVQVGDVLDNVTSFTTLTEQANAFFQSFSGNGSTTAFTLSTALGTEEKALMVFVDAGAGRGYDILAPTAFTVNGTALTFNVAPASGTNNIYVFAPSLLLGAASSAAAAAETSAANALASQVAAALSETNAATSASTATTQATNAATSATQANAIITRWNYSNTVSMGDPSAGNFRLNNSTPNLATAIALSDITANTGAPNVGAALLTWDDSTSPVRGTLTFKKITAPENFLTFNITGALTDNTTWVQIPITNVASGGTILNTDAISIEFSRAGNAGTSFSSADITGQTQTAIATADEIVYSDASNAGALRKDTVQGIINLIPTRTVAQGGTGLTTLTANNVILGNGTSNPTFVAPSTSGNVLTSNGTTWTSAPSTGGARIASATYVTNTTLSATIPADNTIPQISEGSEILSLSFTPVNASSTLLIQWYVYSAADGAAGATAAALFVDSTANALDTASSTTVSAALINIVAGAHTVSAGSTTARTYRVRIGANSGNVYPNGTGGAARLYGGTSACKLIVTEILP